MLLPRSSPPLTLCLSVLLCLSAAAGAQDQDRKLMDRLTRPNMELKFDTSQSSFGRPGVFSPKARAQPGKEFSGTRSFLSREFSSKAYGGSEKKSWFASLNFFTKKAGTKGKYEIPNAGAAYGTSAAATKEAPNANKAASTSAYAQTDLQYLKRNRFDASPGKTASTDPSNLNKPMGYSGDLRPMTIDDVRDLLNKNK